ncbi:MAG TPA: GNAT family N-acetyltransferase [Candidatus Limnocylindrales bacterium]|nr:GNAT family N-acetyltransferase [Candidatus Limnocylindrales bacterium]
MPPSGRLPCFPRIISTLYRSRPPCAGRRSSTRATWGHAAGDPARGADRLRRGALPRGRTGHVKRMWVAPAVRGLGLSRRILAEVERQALAHGVHTLRLETNRALTEAISLYRDCGFREVERFNDEIYGDHFFEKELR